MDTYNSIIYGNFLQPVVHTVWSLTRGSRASTEWKTNEGDLDWILSGILLSVTMLECALRWTYIHQKSASKQEALQFYEELRESTPSLPDMREIFVVRNSIAHGHLWKVSTSSSSLGGIVAKFLGQRRNNLRDQLVDPETNLTPSGLHVIPTLMTRSDFRQIVTTTADAFEALVHAKYLLPQANTHTAIWPDGSGDRVSLRDLPGRFDVQSQRQRLAIGLASDRRAAKR